MDRNTDTIRTSTAQTATNGQQEALKAAIRAAAEASPAGAPDKGRRCAQIAQDVCEAHGVRSLAELPADRFPQAMLELAAMGVPRHRDGPAEEAMRTAGARLDATLASILQARRDVAAYRHEAERVLLPQLRKALGGEDGEGVTGRASEALGVLLAGQLLDIEDRLRWAHEVLHLLAVRLPHVGRALDGRTADAGAD